METYGIREDNMVNSNDNKKFGSHGKQKNLLFRFSNAVGIIVYLNDTLQVQWMMNSLCRTTRKLWKDNYKAFCNALEFMRKLLKYHREFDDDLVDFLLNQVHYSMFDIQVEAFTPEAMNKLSEFIMSLKDPYNLKFTKVLVNFDSFDKERCKAYSKLYTTILRNLINPCCLTDTKIYDHRIPPYNYGDPRKCKVNIPFISVYNDNPLYKHEDENKKYKINTYEVTYKTLISKPKYFFDSELKKNIKSVPKMLRITEISQRPKNFIKLAEFLNGLHEIYCRITKVSLEFTKFNSSELALLIDNYSKIKLVKVSVGLPTSNSWMIHKVGCWRLDSVYHIIEI